jgi:ribonuclease HIII
VARRGKIGKMGAFIRPLKGWACAIPLTLDINMNMSTKLIIGVDEAGYGPSMGPLVVCATAWRVPIDYDVEQMSDRLLPEFQAKPIREIVLHVPMGDSKKVNREKYGQQSLALGAKFLLNAVTSTSEQEPIAGHLPCGSANASSLLKKIARLDAERLLTVPWYADQPGSVEPFAMLEKFDTTNAFEAAERKLLADGIELIGLQARILAEPEYNRQIDRLGNKSTLLSELSLDLVRKSICVSAKPEESVFVYCDKHGGRNRYSGVLLSTFDQEWFTVLMEGQKCSKYSALWDKHSLTIQFKVEGDSIFPSAAASIVAKWTRESLVTRLNSYWQSQLMQPIVPTAGYYVDALRFAEEIKPVVQKLRLSDDEWWRKK